MIGELNQRASVLARTTTPDGGGGYSESWNPVLTAWVRLEPLSGDESFAADALRARVRYRIILRRYALIEAGQRLTIGARTFRIMDVLDEGLQSPALTLLCEELT